MNEGEKGEDDKEEGDTNSDGVGYYLSGGV